jgi:hypothetical protein
MPGYAHRQALVRNDGHPRSKAAGRVKSALLAAVACGGWTHGSDVCTKVKADGPGMKVIETIVIDGSQEASSPETRLPAALLLVEVAVRSPCAQDYCDGNWTRDANHGRGRHGIAREFAPINTTNGVIQLLAVERVVLHRFNVHFHDTLSCITDRVRHRIPPNR